MRSFLRSIMGSSPHMRGTRYDHMTFDSPDGIIPAHAGNTSRQENHDQWKRDHPRTCGEHWTAEQARFWLWESSPHMRGTLDGDAAAIGSPGIIPAHAGNTPRGAGRCCRAGDHPRTCGERVAFSPFAVCSTGSSPHMRGTPIPLSVLLFPSGIIPAHAGNTRHCSPEQGLSRDHPRTCGEHEGAFYASVMEKGSSPHMRGTHVRSADADAHHGIIPAHAGNTPRIVVVGADIGDHPRTCGEHTFRT